MLLRFGVANHRSIRDYQEVFLTASKSIKRSGHTFPVPVLKESAVPIVAVYGSNAAGKSNLIDAMDEIQRAIIRSHQHLSATGTIPRHPFQLDGASKREPTRFDCTFTLEERDVEEQSNAASDCVYEYGFEYTKSEFKREWLYRMVRRERLSTQKLFERTTENGEVVVRPGPELRGENSKIASLTRPNSLFLSAAAQNNHPTLTKLFHHFSAHWTVVLSEENMSDFEVATSLTDYEHFEDLLALVRRADLGITGVEVEDEPFSEQQLEFAEDIAQAVSKRIDSTSSSESVSDFFRDAFSNRKRARFKHSADGGEVVTFGYHMESKGTRTLISLLIPALEALSQGSLLAVDELDTSLHPDLALAFISLFTDRDSNPNGAQLLFSTHDVTLLSCDLLGQDEIWMADKNREGVSKFTPLTDFNLRSRDDIEKAYRNGRLGGVPTIDDFAVDVLNAAE
ncbi:MAG: ATP-binding protein [Gammaproteobacteria bacterium]|nr:ATP-binding protein [Gammaproteobacteria bacterium]MYK28287.1 ATP-binding protein [Gammaproteobacteria bacterium]